MLFTSGTTSIIQSTGLKLRRKWLDESLYKLLLADRKKAAAAKDEVVGLDGDPFTNSQEPPNSFQVGESKQDDKSASVIVELFWKDKGKIVDQRKIEVKLTKVANALEDRKHHLRRFGRR